MLLEIFSTVIMGGVAGYSFIKKGGVNDAEKIQRIFANAGWVGKEKGEIKTIRLRRKRKFEGGMEYCYQLPLGFDRKKVEEHIHILEDGINIRSEIPRLDFKKDIIKQLKELKNKKKSKKEVELSFDGMLKVRVYHQEMSKDFPWTDDLLKPNKWVVPVGNTRNGVIYHDFDKFYSLIVAGIPGFGKSQFLKMLITVLALQNPEKVSFTLIDLKEGSAFRRFQNMKQVKYLGCNPNEAREILPKVQQEMSEMYKRFVGKGFEDVKEAGIKERHFIVIDEGADIANDKYCMELLTDIARRGRGAGYYLVYATQYPTKETVPMQVKRNIPTRLSFYLDSNMASLAVLDRGGAESLPAIPGRAIYKQVKCTTLQTPFMANDMIDERIKSHIRRETVERRTEGRSNPVEFEEIGLSN